MPARLRALNTEHAEQQRLQMESEQRSQALIQDLSDREARSRALLANLLDVVFVFDPSGKPLEVSGNYLGITGYLRDEILEFSSDDFWKTLFPHEDNACLCDELARVQQSLSGTQRRVRLCDRAGEVRWCELALLPLCNDSDQFLGVQGVLRDIGERVQTERIIHSLNQAAEAVQRASLSVQAVLEAVSDELTALGMPSAIVLPGLGEEKRPLVHIGGDAAIADGVRRLMAKCRGEAALARVDALRSAFQGNRTVRFTLDEAFYAQVAQDRALARTLRRQLPPLAALAMPLVSDDRVFGLLCVADKVIHPALQPALEVFARQTAIAIRNAQLLTRVSESEEQYRSIFEAARDGFLLLTSEGRIADANPAASAMFGYDVQRLLGLQFEALLLPECRPDAQQFAATIEAQGHCQFAAKGVRDGGESFEIEVRGTRLAFRGETLLLAVVTDITERIKAQEALLHSERLRALGLMAGGIAHDFNNILMGIQGFAEEAKHNLASNPANAISDLERIMASTQVAAAAVSRLQSLYREVDDLSDFVPLQLDDLAAQVLDVTQPHWKDTPQAEGRTIHIRTRFSRPPYVEGNPSELRRVLINLVINAVQAMPEGGTLTITTGQEAGWSWVSVNDTGVGMTPEVRARLFEPYFTTKKEMGRGLGLALSLDIIKRHRGEIAVESAPGQGATFVVRLPAAQVGSGMQRSLGGSSCGALPVSAGHRVLVVDDDEPLRVLFLRFLERLGQDAVIATDGRVALDLLRRERFDLLITDLGMPDLSGRQVAQHARALYPDLPIILTTGWGETMTPDKLAEMQVSALLSKPFTFDGLATTLEQALRSKR